jgi:hypothetical protein
MINKELVRLLVADLRSVNPGGTPVNLKGKGYLHQVDENGVSRWCCLGRATMVAIGNGLKIPREMIPATDTSPEHEQFGEDAQVLCDAVREAYGFTHSNPVIITPDGFKVPAAEWNDYGPGGLSGGTVPEEDFGDIADAFEKLLEES